MDLKDNAAQAGLSGRPVLVMRVPNLTDQAREALRDYVVESLALGVLVIGQSDTFSLEHVPPLGGVVCCAARPAGERNAELPEEQAPPLREHPEPGAVLTGRNAREKQAILARLKAYRKARGLGCLDELAGAAKGDFTADLLRRILSGEASLDIVQWRQLGKALERLEAGEVASDG